MQHIFTVGIKAHPCLLFYIALVVYMLYLGENKRYIMLCYDCFYEKYVQWPTQKSYMYMYNK